MANMQQFWIFGYGSLMWNPGFDYRDSEPALIHGFHRSLCVYSFVHRGTPERPGLVLGLDRGGSCHGMAFRVAAEKWDETLAYLRAREQVTSVYLEAMRPVRLLQNGVRVEALAYVVDRSHRQYAGKLDSNRLLTFIRQGRGRSGNCADYVLSTLAHLRDMDIHDAALEALAARLKTQAASLAG
ncbi:MAG: gamma-glutamylcyclotransferase [Hyphomicrobiales bacterium]